MSPTPKWKHDCTKCKFLGQTIGGMKLVDLYVCESHYFLPTLVARYGDDGPEYLSTHPSYAHANGHAELFAAKALYEESLNLPAIPPGT